MRALVTGADGFIGRHLVARLKSEGWTVGRVIREHRGTGETEPDAFSLRSGQPDEFFAPLSNFKPDVVFHMAGRTAGAPPRDLYLANVVLASNLFQALDQVRPRPLTVLAGSAAEYGRVAPASLPVTEDHPCAPSNDYGISKYAQTLLGLARADAGFPVLITRIFNPVGPGMSQNLALANFALQLRQGQGRVVLRVGNLDVERDFIDVSEAVRIIVELASQPGRFGGVYNVCSGRAFRLRDVVNQLVELSGRPAELLVDPTRLRPDDMSTFYGSTRLLEAAGLHVQVPDMTSLLQRLLQASSVP